MTHPASEMESRKRGALELLREYRKIASDLSKAIKTYGETLGEEKGAYAQKFMLALTKPEDLMAEARNDAVHTHARVLRLQAAEHMQDLMDAERELDAKLDSALSSFAQFSDSLRERGVID